MGDYDAQNTLGMMYLIGLGVTQNSEKAFKWLGNVIEEEGDKAKYKQRYDK